jgi:hypothetical protein
MAKYLGLLSTDMRGKIGGVVASRGRSGTTFRSKAIPNASPSKAQSTQRIRLAAAMYAWRELNDFEQLSWGAIAATQVWVNSLAQTYTPTGLQLWQQAFINAAFFGELPPNTATGSPTAVVPVDACALVVSGISLTGTAYNSGSPFIGSWILFVSRTLSPSINYVKTISMIQVAATTSYVTTPFGPRYSNRYGALPAVGSSVALRALAVDPVNFYSGTPFISQTFWT